MRLKHVNLTFLFLLPIFAMSLAAQDLTFSDFDTDGDRKIENWEFKTVFLRNYSDDWNMKDDAGLDDEDFFTATYSILDTDDNNLLEENEWMFGYDFYFGDYIVNDFWVYDIDRDKHISYSEYMDALYDTDYYMLWDVDRDKYLDDHELADAVFHIWDVNDNGILNRSEYYRFDVYYRDI